MEIKQYLDSTYLKTPEQAGLTYEENKKKVQYCITEAIQEQFKLVMLRPDMVALARKTIDQSQSPVLVGTVISFPEGKADLEDKIREAEQAIKEGADELDYVVDYNAFKEGDLSKVKKEILLGTKLGLSYNKVVKWIIEVAALNDYQIVQLTSLIKNTVLSNFEEEDYKNVFVKSSTGFYKTENGLPNGATISAITLMLENAFPLAVKAAGGVRTHQEAVEMIKIGVKRIGTSSAKVIAEGGLSQEDY